MAHGQAGHYRDAEVGGAIAQHLLEASQWPAAPGAMIAVVAAAILPVLWRIPETAPMAGWTAEPQPI